MLLTFTAVLLSENSRDADVLIVMLICFLNCITDSVRITDPALWSMKHKIKVSTEGGGQSMVITWLYMQALEG